MAMLDNTAETNATRYLFQQFKTMAALDKKYKDATCNTCKNTHKNSKRVIMESIVRNLT